jgi:hypothetical protein
MYFVIEVFQLSRDFLASYVFRVIAGAVHAVVVSGFTEVAIHFGWLFIKPMAKRMMMVSTDKKISILFGYHSNLHAISNFSEQFLCP